MKRRNLLKAIPAFLITLFTGRKIQAKQQRKKPQIKMIDSIRVSYNKEGMYQSVCIVDKGEFYWLRAKEGTIVQSFNVSKDSEEFAWGGADRYGSEQGARCAYVWIMPLVIKGAQKGNQWDIDTINDTFDNNKERFFEVLNINPKKGS